MSELITKDMPNPEYDVMLIDDGRDVLVAVAGEYGWHSPDGPEELWHEIREHYLGARIESLAAHDADVRDKALTLTDDELAIAEGAYESSIMEYEDDGIEAMSIALKAVAEDRRKQ